MTTPNDKLQEALEENDLAQAREALSEGADPNMLLDGETPALHYAIGSEALVRLLLDHGADPNCKADEHDLGPLWVSAENEGDEGGRIARLLIERGADVGALGASNGAGLVASFAERGDTETVRLLLEKGAPVDVDAVRAAMASGAPEVERLVMEALSPEGREELRRLALAKRAWEAAAKEPLKSLSAILEQSGGGTDILYPAVRGAAYGRRSEALELLASRPEVEATQPLKAELFNVIAAHAAPLIPSLLARGWAVDERDSVGLTPLMCAAATKNADSIETLLAAGADPKVKDQHGKGVGEYLGDPADPRFPVPAAQARRARQLLEAKGVKLSRRPVQKATTWEKVQGVIFLLVGVPLLILLLVAVCGD